MFLVAMVPRRLPAALLPSCASHSIPHCGPIMGRTSRRFSCLTHELRNGMCNRARFSYAGKRLSHTRSRATAVRFSWGSIAASFARGSQSRGSGSSSWSSGRRCIRLRRTRRAKASGLVTALPGLGETQQQKGDQRDGDLDAHSVLRGAEKAADLEGLLDPAEEQLDRPAALVEIGDLLMAASRSFDEHAQHLAAIELDADLAYQVRKWLLRPLPWRAGRWRCGRRGSRRHGKPPIPRPRSTAYWI